MAADSETILQAAARLREEIGNDLHDKLTEAIYADAGQLAARAARADGKKSKFNFDYRLDRILTSRLWGFPLMILLMTAIFWLTIAGANIPSALLADFLQGTVYNCLHQFGSIFESPVVVVRLFD